jgi:hypothetical protein
MTLTHDHPGLQQLATTWTGSAQAHRTAADKAALVLRDHGPVAAAAEAAKTAHHKAAQAETTYDEANQAADRATGKARTAARHTLAAVARWALQHPHLRGLPGDPALSSDEHPVWDSDDIDALTGAEPAAVRDQLNAWAEQAVRIGEALAAVHESAAKDHLATAADLDATAT